MFYAQSLVQMYVNHLPLWPSSRVLKVDSLLVYVHRPLSHLEQSSIEKASVYASWPTPQLDSTSEEIGISTIHTKMALEAAEAAIEIYTLPIPILQHSPLNLFILSLPILAKLSSCQYITNGKIRDAIRHRVRLGIGSMKQAGEVWASSKKSSQEIKKIARSAFTTPTLSTELERASSDLELLGDESLMSLGDFGDLGMLDDVLNIDQAELQVVDEPFMSETYDFDGGWGDV